MKSLVLVVPGRIETLTGGYGYDRRMVAGLTDRGWSVSVRELAEGFPFPDPRGARRCGARARVDSRWRHGPRRRPCAGRAAGGGRARSACACGSWRWCTIRWRSKPESTQPPPRRSKRASAGRSRLFGGRHRDESRHRSRAGRLRRRPGSNRCRRARHRSGAARDRLARRSGPVALRRCAGSAKGPRRAVPRARVDSVSPLAPDVRRQPRARPGDGRGAARARVRERH